MNELKPISELDQAVASGLRALATDLDDTVTISGKIPLQNIELMGRLKKAGIKVFAVTGRAAAFGVALTQYFDALDAAICENGGVVCSAGVMDPLIDRAALSEAAQRLDETFGLLRELMPHLRPDPANFARVTERVFMRGAMRPDDMRRIEEAAAANNLSVVASSIMVHLGTGMTDKARGLTAVLGERLGRYDPAEVMTVGDSPNDAPMFDPASFPVSAGVANVAEFADKMPHRPAYIADLREGEGFAQICRTILRLREA